MVSNKSSEKDVNKNTEEETQVDDSATNVDSIDDNKDFDEDTFTGETVEWTAKEYISPDKNIIWYISLVVVVVAVILLDVFILHAYSVSVLVVVIAAVLVVMSVRPPREINYTLSDKGLYLGDQLIDLKDFKAFGVIHDGKENSLLLIPIKRFRPGLSVYFPVESGESIVDNLGERLPMQEVKLDFVDYIVGFLRI